MSDETRADEPAEVSDERIYEDLKGYQDFGMIEYVLPTEPLGEQWIVGWNGQILKFVTKEGIVGFLAGIQVCAAFVGKQRESRLTPLERMLRGAEQPSGKCRGTIREALRIAVTAAENDRQAERFEAALAAMDREGRRP